MRVPSVPSGGSLTAVVEYRLTVKDNSGVNAFSSTGAQMLPMSFWYPTPNSWFFARGADYAPIRMTVTAPSGRTVIAPGRANGSTYESDLNLQPFFLTGSWDRSEHSGTAVYVPSGAAGESAKRASEIGALASEIDVKGKLWMLPPERMKAAREHRVPLADAAIGLLGDLSASICSRVRPKAGR